MPTLSPTAARYVHAIIVVLTAVSLLGPAVSQLAGVVPAAWLSVASRIVGFAGASVLYVSQSPFAQALLQVHLPAKIIAMANLRQAANDNASAASASKAA